MHILAYIDPGAGALVWQSVLGVFVGGVFYMRRTRKWLGGLLHKVMHPGQKPKPLESDLALDKSKIEADTF